MKRVIHILMLLGIILPALGLKNNETGIWKEEQLMRPEVLVALINDSISPLIVNIGSVEDIQNAISFGAVREPENLQRLKNYLGDIATDRSVVIYCGCCPLSVCPNIKPAYKLLKKKGFKNVKILRLVDGLQEDWTDKGYSLKK